MGFSRDFGLILLGRDRSNRKVHTVCLDLQILVWCGGLQVSSRSGLLSTLGFGTPQSFKSGIFIGRPPSRWQP